MRLILLLLALISSASVVAAAGPSMPLTQAALIKQTGLKQGLWRSTTTIVEVTAALDPSFAEALQRDSVGKSKTVVDCIAADSGFDWGVRLPGIQLFDTRDSQWSAVAGELDITGARDRGDELPSLISVKGSYAASSTDLSVVTTLPAGKGVPETVPIVIMRQSIKSEFIDPDCSHWEKY